MEPSRYYIGRSDLHGAPVETEATPVNYGYDDDQPFIDLWAYWRTIRKRLRVVLAVLCGVIALTFIRVWSETPMYVAKTTIEIEPNAAQGADPIESLVEIETAAENSDQYYKTQCEILKSGNLAARVVRRLGLTRQDFGVSEPGLLSRIGSNLKTTVKSVIAPDNQADRPAPPAPAGDTADLPPGSIGAYLGALVIDPVPGTSLVDISFTTPSPKLSARLANAHVDAYINNQIDMRSEADQTAQRFLQQKLIELREQLGRSEAALNDYRRQKGIIPGLMSLDGKDAVVLDRLADLSHNLTDAQVEQIGLEAEVDLIHKHDYSSLPAVITDTTIQSLNQELFQLYGTEAALSSQFKADYPPLVKLHAKIAELQATIAKETNNIVAAIQTRYQEAADKEKELQDEMNRQRNLTLQLNDSAAQYAILQRDVDTNRQLYDAVLKRLKDVGIAAEAQSTNVSVINTAEPPGGPSTPKKARAMLMSLVIGLCGGLGLAFLLEYMDNTLKNPEEAVSYLRLPNLGVVPEFSTLNGNGSRRLRAESPTVLPPGKELVTSHGSYSSLGEAYRNMRTALLMSRAGAPPKVTLITSAMSREGKTVTAVNISIMLAQLGGNVLLMDCDLRRPRCHRVLALDNLFGLTEVLTGARELPDAVRATEIDNLYFLGAGSAPPNPTELLGSAKMFETIRRLRDHYEYVVIDSPPVLPVSDAMIIAPEVDGVVVVANGAKTPKQYVKSACARLQYARAKILGVVLNKVDFQRADYKYYYHHDYYTPFTADEFDDDAAEEKLPS